MHLEVEPQVRWAKLLNALSSVVLSWGDGLVTLPPKLKESATTSSPVANQDSGGLNSPF